jgi:hypothetical protein
MCLLFLFGVFAWSVVFLLGDLALLEVPEGFPACLPGFSAPISPCWIDRPSNRFSLCPRYAFLGCQVDYFVIFFYVVILQMMNLDHT